VAAVDPPDPPAEQALPEADLDDSLVAQPAKSNNGGGHSLTRVLGLKLGRIVLDPGHGGRDTGTIGPTGLREKEVTLDVAKRLAALVQERMGSEVTLTRSEDESVPLKERTKRANQERADLFVSIHVNSSDYKSVNGVETFYLNLTRSRADLEVAARENAGSSQTIHELSGLVEKIALDDKLQESRDLATYMQAAVHNLALKHDSGARNRGVKKAPFVVLIGAQMPSVLVELGFISNAREEELMKTSAYRQEIAEALYEGISGYANTLSHFQVASAGDE
jgi:N-acetylmuramoyl-L-alanine amidase